MRPHSWVPNPIQRFQLSLTVISFWGDPTHLKAMEESLLAKNPKLQTLVAKSNSGNFTYDGIELGGERVCQEIEEEIQKLAGEGQKVTRLSLVGYSLGGLVARYAIGLLDSKGLFKDIQPVVRAHIPNHPNKTLKRTELHDIRDASSRCKSSSSRITQRLMECYRSSNSVDIRAAVIHDRQLSKNRKAIARNSC